MSKAFDATVYVDADDFDTDELIDALRGRKLSVKDVRELLAILSGHEEDESVLDRATAELTSGRFNEALIWLERYLPQPWRGRLAR